PVPDPRSVPDDHDPDPQHHGPSRLAEGGADVHLHLDRQDLAHGEGLRFVETRGKGNGGFRSPSPPPAPFIGTTLLLLVLACASVAVAGHELPFYPGYYPQEIRIERVAPAAAATLLRKGELHAYVGADPFPDRREPADVRGVGSFGGYVVITFNPAAPAFSS